MKVINEKVENRQAFLSIEVEPAEVEQSLEEALLERSFRAFREQNGKALTEQDLIDLVEQIYTGCDIEQHPDFTHIQRVVDDLQKNKWLGILDAFWDEDEILRTRLQRYHQENVIPSQFRDEVFSVSPRERRRYEVKMPWWYVKSHKEPEDDILFCDMKYDKHFGARFAKEDGWRMF